MKKKHEDALLQWVNNMTVAMDNVNKQLKEIEVRLKKLEKPVNDKKIVTPEIFKGPGNG